MSAPHVDVLFEDDALLAVCKPAGMLTQAPRGIDSIEARVRALRQDRERITGDVYLGIPHRLDRAVSGVLLLTKTTRAARRISRQFEERRVEKTYWAWVARRDPGVADLPDEATWRDHIRKIPDQPRAELVAPGVEGGRPATMHYRLLRRDDARALVEVRLVTGRMHQIRLQAASRGWPVLGDPLYGSNAAFGPAFDNIRDATIALHARSLAFDHPIAREPVNITAPLPPSWQSLMVTDGPSGEISSS
ncbi:MAG: RluA family pseudouridine synthase [Pirellulales bacterium]